MRVCQTWLLSQGLLCFGLDLVEPIHSAIFEASPVTISRSSGLTLRQYYRKSRACQRKSRIEPQRAAIQRLGGSHRSAPFVLAGVQIELICFRIFVGLFSADDNRGAPAAIA